MKEERKEGKSRKEVKCREEERSLGGAKIGGGQNEDENAKWMIYAKEAGGEEKRGGKNMGSKGRLVRTEKGM